MLPSAQANPAKRLRVGSPSRQLQNDITMSDSPPADPGGGTAGSPTHHPRSADAESLILGLIQTETGAADLAQAIKTRRVRDVLKQHGVKIQTDDDVGYNSLPRELRDNIRECFIDIFRPKEYVENICKCRSCTRCSPLAPYACIDSEWRDAIEPVTFQYLRLRELRDTDESAIDDLELFERYILGSRRHYLQCISLTLGNLRSIDDEASEQEKVDNFISQTRQLFNCLEQWDESGEGNRNLRVTFRTSSHCRFADSFSVPHEPLQAELTSLPTTQQITHLNVPFWDPIATTSMLVLLSRMPALRSVVFDLQILNRRVNAQDYGSQLDLFFDSLPRTAPNLECLEVRCEDLEDNVNFHETFCISAFSYSQRLLDFSLMSTSRLMLGSIFAPFSTANFDPDAPPRLMWPNLTDFTIHRFFHNNVGNNAGKAFNRFMLKVGRAIRYMPRIQNLEMGFRHTRDSSQMSSFGDTRCNTEVALNLESLSDGRGHSPLATLSVTHYGDSHVAREVPSEDVVQLWRDSLLHAANASLEVQVVSLAQEEDLGLVWVEDTGED